MSLRGLREHVRSAGMATRIPKASPSVDDGDWTRDVDQDRLRAWIQEALDDPRPPISHEKVMADLRAHIASRRARGI